MRTVQKEKIYGYAFKTVLYLTVLFCLYNVVCILFLSQYSCGKLRSRVSSAVNAVESNIKHAGPKKTENIIYKSNLVNKANDSSWASQIKRATVFAGPARIRVAKAEEGIDQYGEIDVTDSAEIIFKGAVDGLVYIGIRKEIDGQWREYGFPTKVGEKIGKKTVIGGKMFDFTTNYVLQDIVYNVQRPVTLQKKIVDLNEAGEFVGTRIAPGETFMKSTSMIKCEDEDGNIKELWLVESESTLSADRDETVEKAQRLEKTKLTAPKERKAEYINKGQDEIIKNRTKSFEKSLDMLRSVIEDAENGN